MFFFRNSSSFIKAFLLILLVAAPLLMTVMKSDKRPQTYLLPESIGQVISTARQAKGWSLRQLAEAAGVGPTTIHRLEAGDVRIQYDIILRVCDALALRSTEGEDVLLAKTPTQKQELEIIECLQAGNIPDALEKVAAYIRAKKG